MDSAIAGVYVAYILGAIFLLIGWIMNLIAVISVAMHASTFTPEIVIRVVGLFLLPVGGLLGWFY